MSYTILLFILAIIQYNRGNNVWTQCVQELDFFVRGAGGVMQPGTVLQPQMSSQPIVQQLLLQRVPVQYSDGIPPTRYIVPTPNFATSPAQQGTQLPANTNYAQNLTTTGCAQVPQQQIYSPQPMALSQQVPVQYSAGNPSARYVTPAPSHVSLPAERQTPMNTGYAQFLQHHVQPMVEESLSQQIPVQYSTGTPFTPNTTSPQGPGS